MNLLLKILLPICLLLVACGVVYWMLLTPPRPVQVEVEMPALLVEVEVAKLEHVTYFVQSQGTVSARVQTDLVSRVSGPITKVSPNFEVGKFF